MEPWIFSDGTRVHLGGKVEGNSPFAMTLMLRLESNSEHPMSSRWGVIGAEPLLDLSVPYLLDAWLRHAVTNEVTLKSAPEFELPVLSEPSDDGVVRVY